MAQRSVPNNRLEYAGCAPDSQKRGAFARGSAGALARNRGSMPRAVIDTCVMIDMLMESRPRHAQALLLRREIIRLNVVATLPMFAIFEINHATRQQDRLSHGRLFPPDDPSELTGIPIDFIPIDDTFVKKYFDVNLPEMRAGDLVFASLAKGESLPLVTEDTNLMRAAKAAGINVLSTIEYQEELSRIAV